MTEKLSWNQIKTLYPGHNVGLVDVEKKPGTEIILSGVVKYTDEILSYDQLVILAMNNEIELRYTTLDEDEFSSLQGGN